LGSFTITKNGDAMKPVTHILSKIQRRLAMIAFRSSENYWIERYKRGGNSGYGSYGYLAQYKAEFLNEFVEKNSINTVIEYGCGDGNQLTLAKYPYYIGFDISPDAIVLCKKTFDNDTTKSFYLMSEYQEQKADLTLSLDVIYHLVEDNVFETYMQQLFYSSKRYVIVYSSNTDANLLSSPHVRHRQFTDWVKAKLPDWKLISHISNPNSVVRKSKKNSIADFFVYQKSE
jgi:hypothetical protein